MKKRYLIVALLLMLVGIMGPKALQVGNCEVLVTMRTESSFDSDTYICKGTRFGTAKDAIYYAGKDNKIILNNYNGYYLASDKNITLEISGVNSIAMVHLDSAVISVKGNGSLKFREGAFVKKTDNGESVYTFMYKDKTVVNSDSSVYEGTLSEFIDNYEELKTKNKLPEEYNEDDYSLYQVTDYNKIYSEVVSESWLDRYIDTDLSKEIVDGYGYLSLAKEEVELESENVTLISSDDIDSKYKLDATDLGDEEISEKVDEDLGNNSLVSLYDVNVYNGKKRVKMKNGNYTIKIKLPEDFDESLDYQVIYVNDDGEIEEYIDGKIVDGYMVFKTSHLSQYGIVSLEKTKEIVKCNYGFDVVSFLGIIVLVSLGKFFYKLIGFLSVKSLQKNRRA